MSDSDTSSVSDEPTAQAVNYFVNHCYLPKRLPSKDDHNVQYDRELLGLMQSALEEASDSANPSQLSPIDSAQSMFKNMKACMDKQGAIDAETLTTMLQKLHPRGGTIPLLIRPHNAALIISNAGENVVFDCFELSPDNSACIKAKGRLQRTFPSSSFAVPLTVFRADGFQSTLVSTVRKLSFLSCIDAEDQQDRIDAKNVLDRESPDPSLVTELLMSYIRACGSPHNTSRIIKNTRDDVVGPESHRPWRRTPIWLLMRVMLQARLRSSTTEPHGLYKLFMTLALSQILRLATKIGLPSDVLSCMVAKISRRVTKLGDIVSPWQHNIEEAIVAARALLETRWNVVTDSTKNDLRLEGLSSLQPAEDAYHRLPKLDKFITSTGKKAKRQKMVKYEPKDTLPTFDDEDFPDIVFSDDDEEKLALELLATELWVETHLEAWINSNLFEKTSCTLIQDLIEAYHAAAAPHYEQNPETCSMMVITLFELWVAMDLSACSMFTLLREYDPDIPVELLQSLILPRRREMERLHKLENYLKQRKSKADLSLPVSMFHNFGHAASFAVRFFDSSGIHKSLRQEIEAQALIDRDEKCQELSAKVAEHECLMRQHREGHCDMIEATVNKYRGTIEKTHSPKCKRCQLSKKADQIRIKLYEWPLPSDENELKALVFELRVPRSFQAWRDGLHFILMATLKCDYVCPGQSRPKLLANTYSGLKNFRDSDAWKSRHIDVATTARSQLGSVLKRSFKHITELKENDVCLASPLHWEYYDHRATSFTSAPRPTKEFHAFCTYQLPASSITLQKFLHRPFTQPDGPPPNEVISSQWSCPETLSLDEYRTYAALPLGHRLQWLNILVQISVPTLDFSKKETSALILQLINQAGPNTQNEITRSSHEPVLDESFGLKFMTKLGEALARVKQNVESSHAVKIFISLASRILSLTASVTVEAECLEFLSAARAIAFTWLIGLRNNANMFTEETARGEQTDRAVEIATAVVMTFEVEQRHLDVLLSSTQEAAMLLQSAIVCREWTDSNRDTGDHLLLACIHRWRKLMYQCRSRLAEHITEQENGSLDEAISHSWTSYQAGSWHALADPCEHWLESDPPHGVKNTVHFNLVTAELLVNGVPLARLPGKYEMHPTYRLLLGRTALEVCPSQSPGMEFATKQPWAGCNLDFSLTSFDRRKDDPLEDDLLIKATSTSGALFELLPPRLFKADFPDCFIDGFCHWLERSEERIEFRPSSRPWDSSPLNWTLTKMRTRTSWVLSKGSLKLINKTRLSAQTLTRIFSVIEEPDHAIVTHDNADDCLKIDLTRLQLSFRLKKGTAFIQSDQFQDFVVDSSQDIGSLIGLKNKLVLKDSNDRNDRILLVPENAIQYVKAGHHVLVTISASSTNAVSRIHRFSIDKLLGRLNDDGTLHSRLLLSYLHAVTSGCLPDPLTHKTGTEEALTILRSASVRSFDYLSSDTLDLLKCISELSPARILPFNGTFISHHVVWDKNLNSLAQHNSFRTTVESLYDQAREQSLFYLKSENYIEPPTLTMTSQHLVERDNIRCAAFHIHGFGAEDFDTANDVRYISRDCGLNSNRAQSCFVAASLIFRRREVVHTVLSPDYHNDIWESIVQTTRLQNPLPAIDVSYLAFDSLWLVKPKQTLSESWCRIQESLARSSELYSIFQVMIWLSTIAFTEDGSMDIVQTMSSFYSAPALAQIRPPDVPLCNFGLGKALVVHELEDLLEPALVPVDQCPESKLPKTIPKKKEDDEALVLRRHRAYQRLQTKCLADFITALCDQWPCREPHLPIGQFDIYIDVKKAIASVKEYFKLRYDNYQFAEYLVKIEKTVRTLAIEPVAISPYCYDDDIDATDAPLREHHFSEQDVFKPMAPEIPTQPPTDPSSPTVFRYIVQEHLANPTLSDLLSILELQAVAAHEIEYVKTLRVSAASLQESGVHQDRQRIHPDCQNVQEELTAFLASSNQYLQVLFDAIKQAITDDHSWARKLAIRTGAFPRICPKLFVQQLQHKRWVLLPQAWKDCIIKYGLALTQVQRAERLLSLSSNMTALSNELSNQGHSNWKASEYPEALLLEIESAIAIRAVQMETAQHMQSPPDNKNSISQLMMGLGKSSVIVPLVAAASSTGETLTRVIVSKPQSKQAFSMLVSKLGGLLDRQIHHMPFSRSLTLNLDQAKAVERQMKNCLKNGGVLLVQPEHILSFQLMGLDCTISGQDQVGQILLNIQRFLNSNSRDIVDESDENFSVRFEMIYTMGLQRPVEFSPQRWNVIQSLLELIPRFAPKVQKSLPKSIEIDERRTGRFPRVRILRSDAAELLLNLITEHICSIGLPGFPISRQPEHVRQAVLIYISKPDLTSEEISHVETDQIHAFFAPSTKNYLLLLRGLIAGGIVSFALLAKRWKVNYGLDPARIPRSRLAVPYRAKDTPSQRSEFSHPDVTIILSSLSYYYGGLSDEEMFLTFGKLLRSDQADGEFGEWVRSSPELPQDFHQLAGINMKDRVICTDQIFPHLRFSKVVVDWYLSNMVFCAEIREFPQKLSSSGWDIGREKVHPTTGFSGTNDAHHLLPLSVTHLDLAAQRHTNALVLSYLLQSETSVELIPPRASSSLASDADILLDLVLKLDPLPRVIIDVGAFILELSSRQVAAQWLEKIVHQEDTKAVIFVDDNDVITVLDRTGHVEALQSSPFSKQTHLCLVFLSEQHARGIDISLPATYRAAVTLGARLTKDRLCQACMRMRRLGKSQSVVFCVPTEIQSKILERKSRIEAIADTKPPTEPIIEVKDVLSWAVGESCLDLQHSMPLWAAQGKRFEDQVPIWQKAERGSHEQGYYSMSKNEAERFLEPEAKTLEYRFRPKPESKQNIETIFDVAKPSIQSIVDRCRKFACVKFNATSLAEEQERELNPEAEEEQNVEHPAPVDPADHVLHRAVEVLARTGKLDLRSDAFIPAYDSLRDCSASDFDVAQFTEDLLVTVDFATTIKELPKDAISDSYYRPVQWILTKVHRGTVKFVIIISPFEAQHLIEIVKKYKKVTLHVYAPRPNLQYRPLDKLDLFTLGADFDPKYLPRKLVVQLNLFAGQLYLGSYKEYTELCRYLCLAYYPAEQGMIIEPDGYVVQQPGSEGFQRSPVPFIKVLMANIRRNCVTIDRTHIGKICTGTILEQGDFEAAEPDVAVKEEM
ncbi:hypothetical protein EJ05DRAFT_464797 [Pseudovirgaria hyperparasitica]|uniref:ubiquitinyl hydrolase 1 n=1 Tax=Pseudovirgaria hyperparasitica TaxID=470096 RepID=A0A6A6W794_9PEZI|nr:uncharacterized protein EJ05DRAFT_464797 [Pseudovirgaria hyperparasitica]KAF2757894.1 hypothetical protein EJ05DRAFT_464797 [Pseudovirgaria hyperparasitica]